MVRRIFLSDRKLLLASAFGVLLAILLALFTAVGGNLPEKSALFTGDFPAFYGAGRIVADGYGQELYSQTLQSGVQSQFYRDGYLYFAYPPWVAGVFALFTFLPFTTAKIIWCGILFIATYFAARKIRNDLDTILAIFLLPTLLHSNVAGQNAALTVLILAFLLPSISDQTPQPIKAGILAALLTYKPHFGIIAGAYSFFALQRADRFHFIVPFATVIMVMYLLSALVTGFDWPAKYMVAIREFSEADWIANHRQMISIPSLLPCCREILSILVVALIIRGGIRSVNPELFLPLALVLGSAHALYYDFSVLILFGAALEDRRRWFVLAVALAVPVILLKEQLGAGPLMFLALYLFIEVARRWRFNQVEV